MSKAGERTKMFYLGCRIWHAFYILCTYIQLNFFCHQHVSSIFKKRRNSGKEYISRKGQSTLFKETQRSKKIMTFQKIGTSSIPKLFMLHCSQVPNEQKDWKYCFLGIICCTLNPRSLLLFSILNIFLYGGNLASVGMFWSQN